MLLPFVPEMFTCATCGERWPVDVLCGWTFQTREQAPDRGPGQAWCVQCCGCFMHRPGRDPGGMVVWPWRGLDGRLRERRPA